MTTKAQVHAGLVKTGIRPTDLLALAYPTACVAAVIVVYAC